MTEILIYLLFLKIASLNFVFSELLLRICHAFAVVLNHSFPVNETYKVVLEVVGPAFENFHPAGRCV